jgi:NitT/TauT family transport system ATP-binding protein
MYEIAIQGVHFGYGGQPVLGDVEFTAGAGELVCLLGPSGCGKSTLLRLVAGLARPDAGTVKMNGRPVTGPGLDRGVVFQDYSLFPWMTAAENVALVLRQLQPGRSGREIGALAQEYLELVGLGDSAGKLPRELSGGMKQRAAIARVFAQNPPVLLLDEPFGALDAITRAHLQDLLLELWFQQGKSRKTVLFVTHDVDEAILLADRIAVFGLNPGTVKTVVQVDLPRPRFRRALHDAPAFHELRDRILNLLDESVLLRLDAGQTVLLGGDRI